MNRPVRFVHAWRAALVGGFALLGASLCAEAYTLIVSPARYSVLQVAFDVLNRSPSVLVSYQGEGSTAEPVLYAWNGSEWVFVSLKDYREVNFLQRVPDQTVLIGDDAVLPASLVEASSWSPKIVRVRALDTGSLINEIGHELQWGDRDWQWFAARYNLKLQDEAEPRRKSSWYDQQGPLPDRPQPLGRLLGHKASATEPQPVPVDQMAPVEPTPVVEPPPAMIDQPAAAPAEEPSAKKRGKAEGEGDAIDQKTDAALSVFGDPDAAPQK